MKKQILPALALLATATFAMPGHAAGFNYTYAQATYDDFSIDFGIPGIPNFDGDGFTGAGSFDLGKGFFVNGSYSFWDLDSTPVDVDTWQAGGGWHMSLKPNLDLVFSGAFGKTKLSNGGVSVDSDFLAARAAVRYRINKKFEIGGGIGFVDFDEADNETEFHFNGLWNFTDRISGFAEFRDNDVVESISIGARFYFKTKRK
jgi:Outer membrane protein beta-barrel domain